MVRFFNIETGKKNWAGQIFTTATSAKYRKVVMGLYKQFPATATREGRWVQGLMSLPVKVCGTELCLAPCCEDVGEGGGRVRREFRIGSWWQAGRNLPLVITSAKSLLDIYRLEEEADTPPQESVLTVPSLLLWETSWYSRNGVEDTTFNISGLLSQLYYPTTNIFFSSSETGSCSTA